MNVGMLLSSHARFRPEHTAVVFENKRLTFKEFNTRVNKCANALLAMGVRKGDKVATLLPNSLELLEIYWACPKIGAVIVPLSTLLMDKGIISLLRDSESKVLVTSAQFVPIVQRISDDLPDIPPSNYVIVDWARSTPYRDYRTMVDEASEGEPPPIEVRDEDPFNIMYTSGTTGLPKGIVHTHYVRAMYCMTFASCFRMTPESVVLHGGSIVFNGAFVTLMPAMFLGATYVLLRQFEPSQFIESIQREKATHVVMVPSQIVPMLRAPNFSIEALQSLEMICSLGAPLHREYKEELHRKLPGRFYELYGLTEGFITVLDRTAAPHRVDSVGTPTFFSEMRIVDERGNDLPPFQVGEIIGRGPMLMPGYYKRPDLTAEAIREGWLYTGDLGYVDEDGFLYLVDRKKDMIISGGVNVYPRDIEEVIVRHPAVREAAVFGIPDDKWGEAPVAAVVLNLPDAVSREELIRWINEHVEAKFQRVKDVLIMRDFPRNVAGKTLKRVIREEYLDASKKGGQKSGEKAGTTLCNA
jgi:acyl-CoA synthetase (AMP-forming)/AMP-acid ligase II